ncbi:MAG TPA: hypothetical protein PKE40_07310 [Arachnia sp.]|nr:hypothetical protein [Arachnia sp.]HMT86142.1 hypothetical protein [Arachnia sp.]
MRNKFIRVGLGAVLLASAAFGVTACGGNAETPSSTSSPSAPAATGDESAEFVADLQAGVQLINDKLAEDSAMTQIMLASDVDQATQKYGMWVLPYKPSEAVAKYMSTVQIDGGTFVVTATSAESGKEWQMDQDGNLTEVAG